MVDLCMEMYKTNKQIPSVFISMYLAPSGGLSGIYTEMTNKRSCHLRS